MKATVVLILSWLLVLFMQVLSVMEREQTTSRPVAEDYGPYGWINKGKFTRLRSNWSYWNTGWCLVTLTMVDGWSARLRFLLVGL